MKNTKQIFFLLPISIFLIVGSAFADSYVKQKKGDFKGEIDSKRALIYIIRPSKFGFAIRSWTFLDDKFLGLNKGKSYFFAYVDPGRHIIWSKMENISAIYYDFEPGKVYYFKQKIAPGFFRASTQIIEADPHKVDQWIEKAKYSTPTEKGMREGKILAQKHFPRAKEKAGQKSSDGRR